MAGHRRCVSTRLALALGEREQRTGQGVEAIALRERGACGGQFAGEHVGQAAIVQGSSDRSILGDGGKRDGAGARERGEGEPPTRVHGRGISGFG